MVHPAAELCKDGARVRVRRQKRSRRRALCPQAVNDRTSRHASSGRRDKFGRQCLNKSQLQMVEAKVASVKRGDNRHASTGLSSVRGLNALDLDAEPLERNLHAV